MSLGQLPLAGVLVAEVGDRIGASACASVLAQLGATVVVLEGSLDLPAANSSSKWRRRASALAGKLSLVVDPDQPADVALRERLLATADVIICSSDFGPGNRDIRPLRAQVLCDVTAFGDSGPLTGHGGTENLLQSLTGVVHTTGFEGSDPSPVQIPILEMSTGLYAAAAVVAALRVRRRQGFGQRVDAALFDTALNALPNFLALHFAGERAERSGNRHPLYAPWSSFCANDGHVLVCSATADQFTRICNLIGRPDMLIDERFATFHGRRTHAALLEAAIVAWTRAHTVQQCVDAFAALGIACGPVVDAADLRHESNLAHRRMFALLADPQTRGTALVPASALRSDPPSAVGPASIPARGADRDAVATLLAARVQGVGHEEPVLKPRLPALAGVRIVEIGHYTVAPLASRQMGALGADVIKVEPPTGDAIRNASSQRSDGLSHIFVMSNTDKRGLVLDLHCEQDRDRLHALLSKADVLVENLRQGALASRGFGREVLRARHPHLVYCAISGFGADSVYPGRPAYDTVIQAMSGLMAKSGAHGEPLKTGISSSDMIGGQFGLIALLAGLEQRDRFGSVPHFDISMQDASAWITQYDWPGAGKAVPSCLVRCDDGHVLVEGDPRCVLERDVPWRGNRVSLVAALKATGVSASPVLAIPEVVSHPQTVARQLLQPIHSGGDDWTVIGSPLGLRATPPSVRRVMGRLGADDAEVLAAFGLAEQPEVAST
jgi:crotonobetainyl-CoA:carnitine CoA-transferase CaiB-like acyl-CoA transferase